MNTTKKTPGAASSRLRYPAGYGKKSGQYARADLLNDFLEEKNRQQKAVSKEKKLANDRKIRKEARDRRGLLTAKTDGVTTTSELRHLIEGWGSTAVGKLREQTAYKWHGVYRIEGGARVLETVLREAGSEAKIKRLPTADERYEILVTPAFGRYTPVQAETRIPDHAQTEQNKYARLGAQVTYLGAFYKSGEQ